MGFVIVTYDIEEKRVNRIRKILKKYLYWVQNSVFEGEITEGNLAMCKSELKKAMKKDFDSIYFYRVQNPDNMEKEVMGLSKNLTDNFL